MESSRLFMNVPFLLTTFARRTSAISSRATARRLVVAPARPSSYSTISLRRNIKRTIFGAQSNQFSLFRHLRARRFHITRRQAQHPPPNPAPNLNNPQPTPSLSQRLKKLSKEYGYSAVGVYLALSALDFPFCFLAVRLLGTERIGQWEHAVVEGIKSILRIPFPSLFRKREEQAIEGPPAQGDAEAAVGEEEGEATIWTQLALAYVVHKSFIFIRVPLTAAVTPKVVKTLRSWGWNIGKKAPKTK